MNFNTLYLTVKIFFLSVIFFSFIHELDAQTYHFDNYSVKQGLAQSSVYAIEQGQDGFVWMGTASGLSRLDGNYIKNYSTEDGLADGAVKAIYIDTLGAIWLGHAGGGISKLYEDSIQVLFNMRADITSFSPDDEGNLWVSSHGEGVIKISTPYSLMRDSMNFQKYKGQEGISDIVYQIIKLENGNIYFVTDVGVKNYNYQKDDFSFYKISRMPKYFQIICMYESDNKDQWFGSYNGGLYQYKKETGEFKIYDVMDGLASNWISSIGEDRKGNMWIGTWGGGVTRINDESVTVINKEKGLRDNYIRCIKEDREGNILFGTKETGLLVYKGSQFISYGVKNGLMSEQVWSIAEDKEGKIWLGTNEGISVFKNSKLMKSFKEIDGLSHQDVRYIKKDKNNDLWIGTWGGGVMKFNIQSNRFDLNYLVNEYVNQFLVTAMEVDQTNNLWVGTLDGLVYYEIDGQKIDGLTQSDGLAGNDISVIYSDSKNIVWVGSREKGLTKIDGKNIKKIKLDRKITPISIVEDQSGNLWIGTEGKGVLVFDGEKIMKEFTVKTGLLSNYISLLNVDDKGDVWIGTNNGLNRYSVQEDRFYSYSERMGYVGIESKQNATYKDKNGNLWFGTIKGGIKMNARALSVNTLEPITRIENLTVNLEDREMIGGLELSYKEKSVAFNYSSICLSNPENIYYKVMLDGLEESWGKPTRQTFISYPALPPGSYTFKVVASNNNGIWNRVPESYSFKIIPPFWQRTWFIILTVILLTAAIVGFIKFRERKLRIEKAVLEEKVEKRTEELVHQSKELKLKNKDIIDSITYAKRIQDAILPTGEMFTNQLSETFILFNPKDIVSGDFYWLANKNNKSLFAAVDCTGHGVPGAFMSIVGYNLLDKIVGEYEITSPDEILNQLNKGVSAALRQEIDSAEINDGMDISICTFDKETNILEYAGAYNPLYIISDKAIKVNDGKEIEPNMSDEKGVMLYEIKANRFPIGNYLEGKHSFSKHSFKLNKGDTVYLFSDGYADQFGGSKGKKFRYKQFKQLLLAINAKSMKEQREILNDSFISWMGDLDQIDDVVVIGSRL